jgi:hypothetical protein
VESGWIGLIELGVVLAFVLGWGVLELVGLRMDKRRREAAEREGSAAATDSSDPRHAEGQQRLNPARPESVQR